MRVGSRFNVFAPAALSGLIEDCTPVKFDITPSDGFPAFLSSRRPHSFAGRRSLQSADHRPRARPFLAARWRGLVVEKFGIQSGKPIWKKTINGVQYSLGSIPGRRFCGPPADGADGDDRGQGRDGARKSSARYLVNDKIIVAVAGPLFSLLLAVVFALYLPGIGSANPSAKADRPISIIGWG